VYVYLTKYALFVCCKSIALPIFFNRVFILYQEPILRFLIYSYNASVVEGLEHF
jgi:hypothetical protein